MGITCSRPLLRVLLCALIDQAFMVATSPSAGVPALLFGQNCEHQVDTKGGP